MDPAKEPGPGAFQPPFIVARDFGERAREINELYNTYTGRSRSIEAYRWEWYAGPPPASFIWTITEASTQRVVGHHGILRIPLVQRGRAIAGGRTENTIVEPSVRKRLFYPGIEKKALVEATQTFAVLYTAYVSGAHAKVRARLGYRPVGRWVLYLLRARSMYLRLLLDKAALRLSVRLPRAARNVIAAGVAGAWALRRSRSARLDPLEIEEIADVTTISDEYARFWARAREHYDLTVDRSLDFLRWRIVDNPYLAYRTWTFRNNGELAAVVIGHTRREESKIEHMRREEFASVLEIDDLIVGNYDVGTFDAVIRCLNRLDSTPDAIVLRTLAVDTPLHRALRRRFALQAFILRRFAGRLFEEMVGFHRDDVGNHQPWYATLLLTEGSGP